MGPPLDVQADGDRGVGVDGHYFVHPFLGGGGLVGEGGFDCFSVVVNLILGGSWVEGYGLVVAK